jgi:hypothetical protein
MVVPYPLSVDLEIDRVKRCGSANEQSIALNTAKREVGHHFRYFDFTNESAILSVANHTIGAAGP